MTPVPVHAGAFFESYSSVRNQTGSGVGGIPGPNAVIGPLRHIQTVVSKTGAETQVCARTPSRLQVLTGQFWTHLREYILNVIPQNYVSLYKDGNVISLLA